MYFDRFDVCEAWYLFASEYHGGAATPLYGVLSRLALIDFNPSPILSLDSLTENARAIYDELVSKHEAGTLHVRG